MSNQEIAQRGILDAWKQMEETGDRKQESIQSEPPTTDLDIGSRVEMFVDRYLIDQMYNTTLRLAPPQPQNMAVTFDRPWEGPGSGAYASVFFDGKQYRLYYRACGNNAAKSGGDLSARQYTCLALSPDGIHWEKPELDLVEFDGSTKNNIVVSGIMAHNFSPFPDGNPACPPEERFKAVAGHANTGLMAFCSEDGLHWHTLQDEPIIREGAFDSQNLCFYDRRIGKYRCYSRYFAKPIAWEQEARDGAFRPVLPPDTLDDLGIGIRAIQSATSEDFLHWSDQVANTYQRGVPLEHFYTNATIPCPGAEHIYLSMPMRFLHDRHKVPSCPFPGVSDGVFMTSRDGVRFDRTFLEGWLRPGLSERCWTQRNYITAWGLLETSPEELSLFVGVHYEWDDGGIRRYTVRRHGFASVNAPYDGGILVTKPFRFQGDALYLNYATSAAGAIRVGIISDGSGWPACDFSTEDCDLIYGNELAHRVTWRGSGDLSRFAGRTVRLKFEMYDADLYALQFGTEPRP